MMKQKKRIATEAAIGPVRVPAGALRVGAGFLCFCLLSQPLSVSAAEWTRGEDGNYQMADGTVIGGAIARGIDVSYWKMDIDWEQVAADDVSFAMLGTRFRGDVDPYFPVNAQKASEAGLEIGAYIYSYATSVEMAEQEADFVLELIKDYPISYPVAFDAEDNDTLGTLSPSEVSEVINAFCKKIEDAGYYPIVYANENWLTNKIDLTTLDYDIWVARYNTMYTFENPSMWQATNTGSINGVSGDVDIDFLFKDYTSIIPDNTWRTISGNRYYYENNVMQKDTWIDDGEGWYYMNESGNPVLGWMTMPEGSYYLDELTGQMAVGWKELEGNWYYFRSTGLMSTGWRDIDGVWYYLDESGVMQTGWLGLDGIRYYLSLSGAMVTGWQQLDGIRYYFRTDGSMAVGWTQADGNWYYMNESGVVQTGWQEIDGSRYYLDESGVMQTGWLGQNGSWYYLDSTGAMQTGWQEIGGVRYYLNESGVMQTGWLSLDGSWYYLDSTGAMQTGWQTIDDVLYYLDADSGRMAANTVLDYNGTAYQADASGACTQIVTESEGETAEDTSSDDASGEDTDFAEETSAADQIQAGPGWNM